MDVLNREHPIVHLLSVLFTYTVHVITYMYMYMYIYKYTVSDYRHVTQKQNIIAFSSEKYLNSYPPVTMIFIKPAQLINTCGPIEHCVTSCERLRIWMLS